MLLLYFGAAFIAQAGPIFYRFTGVQTTIKRNIPILYDMLIGNDITIFSFCFILSAGLSIYGIPKVKLIFSSIPEKGLLTLFELIDTPVQYKLDRFSNKLKEIKELDASQSKKSGINAKDIFLDITQPVKQIKTIVESIFYYFTSLEDEKISAKVVVFFTKDMELLEDIGPYYYPRDCVPSTPISLLKNPKSPLMTAARTKKPVIIESVKKPPRDIEFVRQPDDDRDGSLLCYPININHLNEVRMVISIFCTTPKFFTKENRAYYEFVLEKFKKRLVIEYSLLILKDRVEAKGGKNGHS